MGQHGASGKHVEDAELAQPGKLVDRAEPVRVACQYKSSSAQLPSPANLEEPILLSKIKSLKNRSFFRGDLNKLKYSRGP
jgi:hypothetical protein